MKVEYWIQTLVLVLLVAPSKFHVVFEEIGSMAGSASYIHCTLNINLSAIDELIKSYSDAVTAYKNKIDLTFDKMYSTAPTEAEKKISGKNQFLSLIDSFQNVASHMKARLDNLRGVLPREPEGNPARLESLQRAQRSLPAIALRAVGGLLRRGFSTFGGKLVRSGLPKIGKPSLFFSLAQGVFGTFMGLYTQRQIRKLQQDVQSVHAEQDRILEVVNQQQDEIEGIAKKVDELQETDDIRNRLNAPLAVAKMSELYVMVQGALDSVVHAVQQAHHRRLSIDFLSSDQLKALYETIEETALGRAYVLLTSSPSDLFQVETSYVSDNENVVLILHVPMVPRNSLLRLFRLRPFPIPFSSTMALLPEASSSLLALSQGNTRLMTTIEHSDLMDCHRIGSVFVCERHSVLFNQIKATCLGALFEQDINIAREVCSLELVPYQEAVLQLQSNWFLIYSPSMFTGYVQCHNGSANEAHIKRGVNKLFVDPSCTLNLRNHSLHSETSLRLDSEIKYFQWEFADMSTFALDDDDIDHVIATEGLTDGKIPLREVVRHRRFRLRLPSFRLLWISLSLATAGLLVVALAVVFGTHRLMIFRQKFQKLRQAIAILIERVHHSLPSARHVTSQLRQQFTSRARHGLRRLRRQPPSQSRSPDIYPNLAEAPFLDADGAANLADAPTSTEEK
jgi:hypothetical protein